MHARQVITHHLPLSEASRGYKIFNDKKEENGAMVGKVRAHLDTGCPSWGVQVR